MNHAIVEVNFKVHADVGPGEEIRLSGNVPALGCYDPSRSILLVTSPDNYPWWSTKEAIFLPGEVGAVKYKYCIFSGGKFKRWEINDKLFRSLEVSRHDKVIKDMEDLFDSPPNYFDDDQLELPGTPKSPKSPTKLVGSDLRSFKALQFAAWSQKSKNDNHLLPQDGVVVVNYFLPVILSKSKEGIWSATWDKENLLSLQLNARVLWIGSVRYANAPIPVEEEDSVARLLGEMNCLPVFINQSMHFQFYDIFCKQNLWPIMHHIADVYGPLNQNDIGAKAQQNLWFVYSTVHKLFREKILEIYQEGYLIWIHGFHLMLLPSFLRRRLPIAKIGYFFHTPFPSSEIWRTMSRREDLLRGLLGADQIGFHLYEYARHFLTTCRRLLGASSEMTPAGVMTITIDGREVAITCIHVGVDLPRLDETFVTNTVSSESKQWKDKFPNKLIVAGIDRLERLKGLRLKLIAIDQFMEENTRWLGKIVFVMIGISALERGQDYIQILSEVKITVTKLNEKYNNNTGDLIYFEERHERDNRLPQRLALFSVSDILMTTAVRDGLNRYPMEFTLARKRAGDAMAGSNPSRFEGGGLPHQGIIIISEFISSARVMRGALTVNPWCTSEVKLALKHALEMGDVERADRSRRNVEFSTRLTTTSWAMHVLHDLKAVEKSTDINANYRVGFGMQYKVMDLKAGFLPLDVKEVCNAYRVSHNRLIVLDWGGTLVADDLKVDKFHAYAIAKGHASREGPTNECKFVLEALCADPKNTVFVVSGREIHAVSEFFGDFKGLGLGAEHGFFYKWPRDEGNLSKSTWKSITSIGDESWKDSARMLMDIYVQRTHGTYIEQKGNALIWQFRDADPEFGFIQSKELEEHLIDILVPYHVQVLRGGGVSDGYIEVRPAGVSKGLFIDHAFSLFKSMNKECDFVLAIGDDQSDEPMFQSIGILQDELKSRSRDTHEMRTFSVTVGKKPTSANSYVDDPSAVLEVLTTLSKCSQRERKFFSSVDLAADHAKHFAPSVFQSVAPLTKSHSASKIISPETTKFPRKSIGSPEGVPGIPTVGSSEEFAIRPKNNGMQRVASLLNMTEYMNSINDSNHEDDGAIFF